MSNIFLASIIYSISKTSYKRVVVFISFGKRVKSEYHVLLIQYFYLKSQFLVLISINRLESTLTTCLWFNMLAFLYVFNAAEML